MAQSPIRNQEEAEKKSPNYRASNSPTAENADCKTQQPPATPSSAAENHDEANQKCTVGGAQTASKDEHEKATG